MFLCREHEDHDPPPPPHCGHRAGHRQVCLPEHAVRPERSQPVAVAVAVVAAGSSVMTLDEGNPPETLQTGSGGNQGLTRALRPRTGLLQSKGS